jgi:hypothetical protein
MEVTLGATALRRHYGYNADWRRANGVSQYKVHKDIGI